MLKYIILLMMLLSIKAEAQLDSTRFLLKGGISTKYENKSPSPSNQRSAFELRPVLGLNRLDKHGNINEFQFVGLGTDRLTDHVTYTDSIGANQLLVRNFSSFNFGLGYAKLLILNKKSSSRIKYGASLGSRLYYIRNIEKQWHNEILDRENSNRTYTASIYLSPTFLYPISSYTWFCVQSDFVLYQYTHNKQTYKINGNSSKKGEFTAFPKPVLNLMFSLFVRIK